MTLVEIERWARRIICHQLVLSKKRIRLSGIFAFIAETKLNCPNRVKARRLFLIASVPHYWSITSANRASTWNIMKSVLYRTIKQDMRHKLLTAVLIDTKTNCSFEMRKKRRSPLGRLCRIFTFFKICTFLPNLLEKAAPWRNESQSIKSLIQLFVAIRSNHFLFFAAIEDINPIFDTASTYIKQSHQKGSPVPVAPNLHRIHKSIAQGDHVVILISPCRRWRKEYQPVQFARFVPCSLDHFPQVLWRHFQITKPLQCSR